MRTFLPPGEPRRPGAGPVRGIQGADAVVGRDAGPPPPADHRLVRTGTMAHWSVIEPTTPADERAWARALGRIASPPERGGWAA